MKCLIVDDDAEKKRLIAECVFSSGVSEDDVVFASSVIEAKRQLTGSGFDLLVLDINLPNRADQFPTKDGGLEVLRWLKGRGSGHMPAYVVGMTAYNDAYEGALSEFDNLVWTIIPFSSTSNVWRVKLGATISLIDQQIQPPFPRDGTTYHAQLAVVTALQIELDAVQAVSTSWRRIPVRGDETPYFIGTFEEAGERVEFVAVCATDKGLPGAAVATTKLIDAFHPRLVAMTGICAGVSGKVKIGDILVADPTWDWGSGKFRQKRGGLEEFHPAAYQMRLEEGLRNKALILGLDKDWLASTKNSFRGDIPPTDLNVYVGAVASGGSVLQSSSAVRRLITQHKDLIGIEMEIFSLMFACHVSTLPRPRAIALKSVCDFGNRHKNNRYQAYAAYTSASALRRLALDGLVE
jgi:nucleoside phosphorylase/CheY-like chemotaxis protein